VVAPPAAGGGGCGEGCIGEVGEGEDEEDETAHVGSSQFTPPASAALPFRVVWLACLNLNSSAKPRDMPCAQYD
jgi:hypothetical protein